MSKAFIVYSSNFHVPYMKEVLSVIKTILKEKDILPQDLSLILRGGDYIHERLNETIKKSDLGIVILDGLRPNVAYEYGLLQMKGIHIIPLKRNNAEFAIKTLFYNPLDKDNKGIDPQLMFGDWRYKHAGMEHLRNPLLNIPNHFSDISGISEVRYETIDDTEDMYSLGHKLRIEVDNILPELYSEDGIKFSQLFLYFPEEDPLFLEESIRNLALFSILGLRKNYETDDEFEELRKDFFKLFTTSNKSINDLLQLYESLLKYKKPIVQKYGRYLKIDSIPLIKDTFAYFSEHPVIFSQKFNLILSTQNSELIKRFLQQIQSKRLVEKEKIDIIGDYLFAKSNLFPDISVIQDYQKSQLFATTAYIFTKQALKLLEEWIKPLSPVTINEKFPFKSNIRNPGNPQDPILWFLSRISKFDSFFESSVTILLKFAIAAQANKDAYSDHVHSSTGMIAVHQVKEQFYPLEGSVSIERRWKFINFISFSKKWPELYTQACISLKFSAIKNFLETQWHIADGYSGGSVNFRHMMIDDLTKYEILEQERKKAFKLLMKWANDEFITNILENAPYNYLINQLAQWNYYFPWTEIETFIQQMIEKDQKNKSIFRNHIQYLRKYPNWRTSYSDDDLNSIFIMDDEYESKLTPKEFFKKNLAISEYDFMSGKPDDKKVRKEKFHEFQTQILEKYHHLTIDEREEINRLLIFKNFISSSNFGHFFAKSTNLVGLLKIIDDFQIVINEGDLIEFPSFFSALLWNLHKEDELKWEKIIEGLWNNKNFYQFRINLLWTNLNITDFTWEKFRSLVNSKEISPDGIISFINVKPITFSISHKEINEILESFIDRVGKIAHSPKRRSSIMKSDEKPIYLFYANLSNYLEKSKIQLEPYLAKMILDKWLIHAKEILENFYDNILIEWGKIDRNAFIPWLKVGLSISHPQNSFLKNASKEFSKEIFGMLKELFSLEKYPKVRTNDHTRIMQFEISGDVSIMLNFTFDQFEILYTSNPKTLGNIVGRIFDILDNHSPIPHPIRNLILKNHKDSDFQYSIYSGFNQKVRSFTGNSYEQAYKYDIQKLIQWSEMEDNRDLKDWLKIIREWLKNDAQRSEDSWKEREVE